MAYNLPPGQDPKLKNYYEMLEKIGKKALKNIKVTSQKFT